MCLPPGQVAGISGCCLLEPRSSYHLHPAGCIVMKFKIYAPSCSALVYCFHGTTHSNAGEDSRTKLLNFPYHFQLALGKAGLLAQVHLFYRAEDVLYCFFHLECFIFIPLPRHQVRALIQLRGKNGKQFILLLRS